MMDMEQRCHLSWSENFKWISVAGTYGVMAGGGPVREGGKGRDESGSYREI